MAKVTLYKVDGTSAGEMMLSDALFNVSVNENLVHEAVVHQKAKSRVAIAHAKDRSEVRGGGRKPWRQKGTGRARHGSRRSPIWAGGGVTFGPSKDQNFATNMNRKARRKALAMVLTDKVASERFVVIEDLVIKDGKTKQLSELLTKLPVANKKVLIVLDLENKDAVRAAQNLQKVATLPVNSLNVVDLLSYDYILTAKETVESMTQLYKR